MTHSVQYERKCGTAWGYSMYNTHLTLGFKQFKLLPKCMRAHLTLVFKRFKLLSICVRAHLKLGFKRFKLLPKCMSAHLTLGFKRFKLLSKCVRALLSVSLVMNSTQQIKLETFLHHKFHTLLAKFWITAVYCRQHCCLNRLWYNLIQDTLKKENRGEICTTVLKRFEENKSN